MKKMSFGVLIGGVTFRVPIKIIKIVWEFYFGALKFGVIIFSHSEYSTLRK
jgi:hypothetical protein